MHRLVNGQKQILFAVGKLEILIRSQEGTPAGVPGPDNLKGEARKTSRGIWSEGCLQGTGSDVTRGMGCLSVNRSAVIWIKLERAPSTICFTPNICCSWTVTVVVTANKRPYIKISFHQPWFWCHTTNVAQHVVKHWGFTGNVWQEPGLPRPVCFTYYTVTFICHVTVSRYRPLHDIYHSITWHVMQRKFVTFQVIPHGRVLYAWAALALLVYMPVTQPV